MRVLLLEDFIKAKVEIQNDYLYLLGLEPKNDHYYNILLYNEFLIKKFDIVIDMNYFKGWGDMGFNNYLNGKHAILFSRDYYIIDIYDAECDRVLTSEYPMVRTLGQFISNCAQSGLELILKNRDER